MLQKAVKRKTLVFYSSVYIVDSAVVSVFTLGVREKDEERVDVEHTRGSVCVCVCVCVGGAGAQR